MIDNNAYIVVAQTHDYVLEDIRRQRNPDSRNNVFYTTNPGDVLDEALRNPVDIVITGQMFYQSDLRTLDDFIGAMLGGMDEIARHFKFPKSGPDTGTQLSEEIYKINPNILVFRYSMAPRGRGKIVGDINKHRGDEDILELIDSDELQNILRTGDWGRLKKTFPKIRFYSGWEEEHKFPKNTEGKNSSHRKL